MKKYLMTAIAAVALGAAFVSCSHSEDLSGGDTPTPQPNPEKQKYTAELIKSEYNALFEKTFGKVGANVDWGFGSDPVATRAFTRGDGLTFPQDCAASEFDPDLTNIPSYDQYCATLGNANWTPDEFACGEVYIDKAQKVHIWGEYGKRAKLYIKAGTYDFTNITFDLCADADLYLLSGATLTLNNAAASTAKFDIYIASGAKLIAKGQDGLRADVDAHVYNHGTIECSRFEVNGTSFLYNVGTLKSSGDVYIANSTSRIVNDGTIESASVNVEGSGALQNNADWTVSGNTIVSCTDGGWVNNGHWKTKNYGYTAGSVNVINNCYLEVTEDFDMNISSSTTTASFKIDSGGGVLTKNFNGGKVITDATSVSGPYKIVMGNACLFKVTNTATLEGGNPGWGFFGPSSGEYAVFQAKNVVRNTGLAGTQGAVTYSGNLYVSAETHFAQGNDGNPNNKFIYEQGGFSVNTNIYAEGFKPGRPSITIEKTSCNPGFDGGGDPNVYRVIVEDLNANETSSDFDFNDAVFDVYKENGKWMIKLRAAGGIYPLTVDGKEVHQQFGYQAKEDGTYDMINTGQKGGNIAEADLPKWECSNQNISSKEDIKNITVTVTKPEYDGGIPNINISLYAEKGGVACKILVDGDYTFCKERTGISTDYQYFNAYVQGTYDANARGGKDWWK